MRQKGVEQMREVDLRRRVDEVRSSATPASLEQAVESLLREGEDVGGGVNASRLVKFVLGDAQMGDEEVVWAYDRLKPVFRAAFEEIPSLYYFEGD